ncbi:threonine and homoserine efflux system [compost metagenome]
MYAMRHLPPSIFGVLLSASPAAGAIAGWLILDEVLTLTQWLGIAAIAMACAGAALVGRRRWGDASVTRRARPGFEQTQSGPSA